MEVCKGFKPRQQQGGLRYLVAPGLTFPPHSSVARGFLLHAMTVLDKPVASDLTHLLWSQLGSLRGSKQAHLYLWGAGNLRGVHWPLSCLHHHISGFSAIFH